MEAGVLALVCLSPWAFGAVEPEHEFLLDVGIAVLMILWCARMLLERQLSWRKCPVAVCLAAWILLGVWQLTPLPRGLLSRISPVTTRMYDRLLPAQPEVLPFGETNGVSRPPAGSTLSFYPGATRQELGRYMAILLLFAVVRNNIASFASLRHSASPRWSMARCWASSGWFKHFSADTPVHLLVFPCAGRRCLRPFHQPESLRVLHERLRGPGAGLLLSRYASLGRMQAAVGPSPIDARDSLDRWPDPVALGMIFALALMISSVIYSLSRGGFLAILGGSILGLAIGLSRSRWSSQGRIVLLTLVTVVGLVSWFGYDRVVTRLGTFQDDLMSRGRRTCHLVPGLTFGEGFPVVGVGLRHL